MTGIGKWRIWLWLAVFSALSMVPCACLAAVPATVQPALARPIDGAGARLAVHTAPTALHRLASGAMFSCECCRHPAPAGDRHIAMLRCAAHKSSQVAGPVAHGPAGHGPLSPGCDCGCRWKDSPPLPGERVAFAVPTASPALLPTSPLRLPHAYFEAIPVIAQRGLSPPQFSPPRSLPPRAPPLA